MAAVDVVETTAAEGTIVTTIIITMAETEAIMTGRSMLPIDQIITMATTHQRMHQVITMLITRIRTSNNRREAVRMDPPTAVNYSRRQRRR